MQNQIGMAATVQSAAPQDRKAAAARRPAPVALAPVALAAALLASATVGQAEIYPRIAAAEGTVVARKSGEEASLVELPRWRPVDVDQDLLAGDTLRTNAAGNLTIRFADKSLVRMGRNTTLLVKKISNATDSLLGLTEGAIWARAARGGNQLKIETPAAAAAIRGTDWTLRVSGNQTTLTVLEGAVELFNANGSVLVRQGEGATVTLGQAPRKYRLVELKEREQLLLYTELRDVFADLSPSGMAGPQARAERRRILALDPPSRSTADWLTLAETALTLTGRQQAREALAQAGTQLEGQLQARARLVEAMLAGQDQDYAKAASLFAAALPALPQDRRATAAYGIWFARSLAEPDRAIAPPDASRFGDDPAAVLAQAQAVAHLQGQAAAISLLEAAEKRFARDARLPAMRAALALELDRRSEVEAALGRARALDPDEPAHLLTSAQFRSAVASDVDGALADLQHAVAVAPGISALWNEIGIVQSERNAIVEADAAHRRAIALNPENPALHANYARFLMDNDQVPAAGREIDIATRLDANSYAVLAAKGRYLLRIGKTADGEKALLDASAVNPTYGDALIGLAIASYQQGAGEETEQALDNADRFDPQNPSISLMRAGIALDRFQADRAIVEAREALRRRQMRGGYYSGYDTNRQAASYLGVALDNLGLMEWSQYYSDRAADPFKASTYIDEAGSGRDTPFVSLPPSGLLRMTDGISGFSSELQGRLLDPLSFASEVKGNSLERRSFVEAAISGSYVDLGSTPGSAGNVEIQGTSYSGIPLSYRLQGDFARAPTFRDNSDNDFQGGMVQLGLRPSLTDSVVLFANRYQRDQQLPGQTFAPTPFDGIDNSGTIVGGAWSRTLGERNTLQAFAVASDTVTRPTFRSVDSGTGSEFDVDQRFGDRFFAFGLSHLLGIGPVTLRYGAEATSLDSRIFQQITEVDTGDIASSVSFADHNFATRTYADATVELSRDLQFAAGAYWLRFDDTRQKWGPLDYRLGVAWAPVDGHWLRAYLRQETAFITSYTLSPISTLGLSPMELPLSWGGQTRTAALRWDGEWNDRFFTRVEYQHQRFNGLSLAYEDVLSTAGTSIGEIDRFTVSGNAWLGGGLGAFASLSLNESRDLKGPFAGSDVPLVPDYVGQVGLKYVHPSRVTAAIAQNFIGRRTDQAYDSSGSPVSVRLDRYSTTDAALTWTSPSRSLDFNLAVTNIFDNRVDRAFGIPDPGRTIRASLTARF